MVIECCSQERTYTKFYGLIGERFAKLNRFWTGLFEESFGTYYDTIHRYETNRLRNVARFFGHQLSTDALGWHVLSVVHINEEETTASSRIFIKILFQDLAEAMGMKKLQERLKDPFLQEAFSGLFPKDNPRNTRFSINYFTSIGMGGVTEDMREHLKNNVPPPAAIVAPPARSESVSSRSSYSSRSRSSSSGRSRSRSRSRSFSRSVSRSPTRAQDRGRKRHRSYSSSRDSRSRSRSYDSYSSRSRSRSYSRSRSRPRSNTRPTKRARGRSYTRSITGSRSLSRSLTRSLSSRRSVSYTPPPRKSGRARSRSRSYSSVRSYRRRRSATYSSRSRSGSRSPTPPRRAERNQDRSLRSPPARRGRSYTPGRSRSRSRSRSRGHDGKGSRHDFFDRSGDRPRGRERYRSDARSRDDGDRNEGPVATSGRYGGRGGGGRVRAADFL